MAFTLQEIAHISQKYKLGIMGTSNIPAAIKYFYNENFPAYAALPGDKIYIDAIPGAKTYPQAVANASLYPLILQQTKIRLTLDTTSNDRAYEARQVFGNRTTPTIGDWIYPQFVQIDGGASAGYGIAIYIGDPDLGGTKIAETYGQSVDMVGWNFEYSMGVVVCSTAEAAQFRAWYDASGLWARGFRYIGNKSSSTGIIPYLYQLKDVMVSSTGTTDGFVLTYNTSTGKWIATSTGTSYSYGDTDTIRFVTSSGIVYAYVRDASLLAQYFQSINAPIDQGVPVWDTTTGMFVWTSTEDIGAQYLYELRDVSLTSTGTPTGVVLEYNTSSGKWHPLPHIRLFDEVVNAEAALGYNNNIIYISETDAFYKYTSTGGAFARDGLFTLNTVDGGNTRWLAVAGQYTLNEINSTQTFNLKEQLSTPSPLTGYIKAFAYQSQGNDIYTRLLLHFNNGDGSTVFDDSSPYNEVVTGYNGIAQSDTVTKFGISAGFYDGVNQYLSIPQLNFNFLTDDFSIDSWVYLTEAREHILYSHGDDANNLIKFYITLAKEIALKIIVGGVLRVNIKGGEVPLLAWHHIAMQRDGNNWYLYIDGVRVTTGVSAVSLNFASAPLIGSNVTSPSTSDIFSNLYGYWKLNENVGVAINDSSGNGRNGTLNVGAWVPGVLGSALQFTGIATNYVNLGAIGSFENNESFSFACWFRTAAAGQMAIMSKQTGGPVGYDLELNAGAIRLRLINTNLTNLILVTTSVAGFNNNVWRHLVCTYDGSRLASGVRIYVDGALEALATTYDTLTGSILNAAPFNISGRNNGTITFNGSIDDCAVWHNRVLGQTDATYLYNAGAGRYVDALITSYLKAYADEYRICKGTVRYPNSVFGIAEIPYGMTSPYWILPDGSIVGLKDLGFIGTKQWGENGSDLFREDGRVDVYKDFGSGRDYIRVRNVTGSQITQYKIVRAYGYDSTNNIPHISPISSFTQTPIGVVPQNISDGDIDFILKRGVITVAGFDTTGSSFVAPVFSTSTGDLTLDETPLRIGKVVSLNANGTIYVNIGGERSNVLSADTNSIELKTSSGILTATIKDEGVKEPHLDVVNLPLDGDYLQWDTSTGRFIWSPISQSLAGLTDVNIPAPVNGQALIYNSSTGKWIATSTGGSGALPIYYNGTLLDAFITELNFEGVGLSVEDTIVGQRATIYVPPAAYSPYYNVGGAAVPNIGTSNRYVASPTIEGTPYKIGGWVGGTQHACTNSGAWNYTAAGACSFKDLTTTIEAILYDADGTTPLATHTTAAITGNIDVTVNNIRIRVTGWAPEVSRYKGLVTVDYTTSAILVPGGRCSIKITHHNAGTDYTKTQNDIFYDPNTNPATLAGGATTITSTGGFVVTKFISGVEYFTTGSQFTLNVSDIDYINMDSYPNVVLDASGSEYGLSTLNLGTGSLTGWANFWDNVNSSYTNTAWTITAVNFFSLSTTANVSARVEDWIAGLYQNSADANVAIETHNTASTRLNEYFYDESWRCSSTGNFDLPNQKGWTSSNDLTASDACFYNGGVERNVTNFQIYNPSPLSQPNYTGQSATVYLWRQFDHDGTASSSARINITGTYTSLEMKMADAWTGLSDGGTVWVNCLSAYNGSLWNAGNPSGSTGSQTGSGAGYIDVTFGVNNIQTTNNQLYLKIGFTTGQRVTILGVVFN